MSYKVDFDALDMLCVNINTQVSEWNENISSVSEKLNIILSENQITGNGAENIKSYIQTVHVAIIQSLLQILQSHGQNCLMYKSDYQQNIDTSLHAIIQSEDLFDIRKSLTTQRSEMWLVDRNVRNALTSVSDLVYTSLKSSDEMDEMYGTINSTLLDLESDISNLESNHLNNDFDDVQNMIKALKTFINDQLSRTKNYLVEYTPHQLANSEIYANLYNANEALTVSQSARSDELQIAYEHESHRAELLEEEAAQKREEEGWWNALAAVGTIVVGAVAIVCTAGMATPVVVTGVVAGSCTIAYGASNLTEAGQDIYYGANGDATTVAINPIRDTVFAGNQELYDIWGGISTTVAGFVVPVGEAYTAAKAAKQTTKAVVGTVVKATVKEVGQDAFVNIVSSGTGSAVMNMTGDANVSRLFSMGAGFFVGGRTNQALDSLDNVSSTVRTLDNLDTVTDVTRTLDDVTDGTKTVSSLSDLMSPEDAVRYNNFLENGSTSGLTQSEVKALQKVDDAIALNKINYDDVLSVRNNTSSLDDIITDGSHMQNGSLRPNITYKAGEHDYIYKTNQDGLIINARADNLQLKTHEGRLDHNPNTPGKQSGDHAGHLFGDRFGGSPELDNLVSQARKVNLSEYKIIENKWAKALENGQKVSVDIKINYKPGSARPTSFDVSYTIDNVPFFQTITQ